jgi:hypothetical protein
MMSAQDILVKLEKDFSPYLQQMTREDIPFAEKGKEKLWFRVYRNKGGGDFPLKKAAFMVLDFGMVWNKDDKTKLDEDELVVGSFLTRDDLPLPILALEASMHYDKYDHLNIDLFPVSRDPRYRETFCKPVQALHKKYRDLPDVAPGVITPNLPEGATSGGMLSGNFDISYRDKTLAWWFAYIDLYKSFLDNHSSCPLLKVPEIIEEGKKIRTAFLGNFAKASPNILADIPNLNTPERGMRLGELMFLDG